MTINILYIDLYWVGFGFGQIQVNDTIVGIPIGYILYTIWYTHRHLRDEAVMY